MQSKHRRGRTRIYTLTLVVSIWTIDRSLNFHRLIGTLTKRTPHSTDTCCKSAAGSEIDSSNCLMIWTTVACQSAAASQQAHSHTTERRPVASGWAAQGPSSRPNFISLFCIYRLGACMPRRRSLSHPRLAAHGQRRSTRPQAGPACHLLGASMPAESALPQLCSFPAGTLPPARYNKPYLPSTYA